MSTLRIITLAAALAVSRAALVAAPLASAKGGDGVKVAATARRARRRS